MADLNVLERAQYEYERRLREVEAQNSVLKSQFELMISNTEDIKSRLTCLTTGMVSSESVARVETIAASAHRRLDEMSKEFWQLQVEHKNCLKVKDDSNESMEEIKTAVNDLKLDMNTLKGSVSTLQSNKDSVVNFFSTRLGVLVDKGLQFLPWILMYLYVQSKLHDVPTAVKTLTH